MTIQRMDHVGVVIEDLAAATAFFVELGLELQGESPVEGGWVDRVVGLEGVRAQIAMMETPDGHGRIELAKFHAPSGRGGERHAPANTPGIRHITFAVDDIDAVLARLQARGAELGSQPAGMIVGRRCLSQWRCRWLRSSGASRFPEPQSGRSGPQRTGGGVPSTLAGSAGSQAQTAQA